MKFGRGHPSIRSAQSERDSKFPPQRKYGVFVRARYEWKQFRELTSTCLTHNLDQLHKLADTERERLELTIDPAVSHYTG